MGWTGVNGGGDGHLFFFILLSLATPHAGSQFPGQGSSPCTLQWKHRVSTAEPPGPWGHLFCLGFMLG